MSTLEHIRKRPALVISVLGLALVLFIITGFGNDFMNLIGDRTTAVKVNGKKISIEEIQSLIQEQAENRQGGSDNARRDAAVNQAINKALLDEEVKNLGIKVTDQELANILSSATGHMMAAGFIQQYQLPFASVEEFSQAANAANANPGVVALWNKLQDDLTDMLISQKFGLALSGVLQANKVDAQSYYNDNTSTAVISYARVDNMTVNNDDVEVTDEEVTERYNQERAAYALDRETRLVDYILVRTEPSLEDFQNAMEEVNTLVEDLATMAPAEAIAGNYAFEIKDEIGRADKLSAPVKNRLDEIVADGTVILERRNNRISLAHFNGVEKAIDDVKVSVVLFEATHDGDSVLNVLSDVEKVQPLVQEDEAFLGGQDDIDINVFEPAFNSIREEAVNAETGMFFIPEDSDNWLRALAGQTSNGAVKVAVRVESKSEPGDIYNISYITRNITPSNKTLNGVDETLRSYIAANPTADKFGEPEEACIYPLATATVDNSMLSFNDLPTSDRVARWVMEAKKGDVSKVFSDAQQTYMIVLAVKDIYNNYTPVTDPDVANEIRATLTAEKKAQKLVDDFAGKATDLEGYAELMGTAPMEAAVVYNQGRVPGFRTGDASLLAHVVTAEEGVLVGPFATQNGAAVIVVNERNQPGREFDFESDAANFAGQQITPMLQYGLNDILRGNAKIEYDIQRFYGNEN